MNKSLGTSPTNNVNAVKPAPNPGVSSFNGRHTGLAESMPRMKSTHFVSWPRQGVLQGDIVESTI